jgi:hypothetical protein
MNEAIKAAVEAGNRVYTGMDFAHGRDRPADLLTLGASYYEKWLLSQLPHIGELPPPHTPEFVKKVQAEYLGYLNTPKWELTELDPETLLDLISRTEPGNLEAGELCQALKKWEAEGKPDLFQFKIGENPYNIAKDSEGVYRIAWVTEKMEMDTGLEGLPVLPPPLLPKQAETIRFQFPGLN